MTTGDSRISGAGKKKLRRGCAWTLIVFCLGMYAGLAFAKKAITGPDWVRKYSGITLPAPPPVTIPPQNAPNPAPNQPLPSNSTVSGSTNVPQGGYSQATTPPNANSQSAGGNVQSAPTTNKPAPPQTPPEGGWLVGTWEITDELHPTGGQASSVTTDYIFDVGGTGEFDANGKKLYDLHWEDAGDYAEITFVTDTDGEQNLKVKMKYSINADHSLLTMASEGKKDPREMMYSVGPGVYHRKP